MMETLKRLKNDEWGRMVFKNISTGQIFKDVDGVLHNITKMGEPDCPLKNQDWHIIYQEKEEDKP